MENEGRLHKLSDEYRRLVGVTPATYNASANTYAGQTNAESVDYTYDSQYRLSTISTQSTTYTFSYDIFGNQQEIGVGDTALATYEYNEHNGKLKKVTYGNGHIVEYVYNSLEMLAEIWYTDSEGMKTKAHPAGCA